MTYELHPLCTLFPRMSGSDFDALKSDIAANGLSQPIVIHRGMILDGGNRYRACVEIGIEPRVVRFDGDNIVAFVLSANLHRRHMSTGQQAAIVASAQDWAKAQVQGANRHTMSKTGNVTGLETVASRQAQSGASDKTQRMADTVARKDPELIKRVAHGEISLPKAHEQVAPKPALLPEPAAQEPQPEDDGAPDDAELESLRIQEEAAAKTMQFMLASDDVTADLAARNTQLEAQIKLLDLRIAGLQNSNAEYIRTIKSLQAKIKKMGAPA